MSTRGTNDQASRETLLRRASICYERAQLWGEAVRLDLEIGDDGRAAAAQEQMGLLADAAQSYERLASKSPVSQARYAWMEAARCYGRVGIFEAQANALIHAGDALHAAWVRAHCARLYQGARSLLSATPIESPVAALESEVIHARCEAGTGLCAQASRRLHRALAEIRALPMEAAANRALEWTIAVARTLARHDLSATAHAMAWERNIPGALDRWHTAAKQSFGTAVGIPGSPAPQIAKKKELDHE